MQTRQTRRTRTEISWRQLLGEMFTRREMVFVVLYLVLAGALEWKSLTVPSFHLLWVGALCACACAVFFMVVLVMGCEAITVYHGDLADE